MIKINITNIENLIKPISVNSPCGVNLQKDESAANLYFQLREARNCARTAERKAQQGLTSVEKPNWQRVYQLSHEILTEFSKDLEVASYLAESLLRLQGFAGLGWGFYLMNQLVTEYWDQLFPLPDEDGVSTKLLPIANLNGLDHDGTLIVPLALMPLTDPSHPEVYALWHYQQAQQDPEMLKRIQHTVAQTSKEFYLNLHQEIYFTVEQYQNLNYLLENLCGNDAPASSKLLARLKECLACIKDLAGQHLATASTTMTTEPKIALNKTATHSSQDRQAMLDNITQAAAYFRHQEPHSPISYLLEKAVKWGQMSLPELLQEIIDNEDAKVKIASITGIELASLN